MTTRSKQTLLFLAISLTSAALAYDTLPSAAELWFYPVIVTRLSVAVLALLLAGYAAADRRRLPLSSGCIAFLVLAVTESALCFLQGGEFGASYAVVCVSLVLSSAQSDLDVASAFLAFLPSQALILVAPLLALPVPTWFHLISAIAALVLPVVTLICSAIVWTIQSIATDRKALRLMMKHLSQQQRLLTLRLANPVAATAVAAPLPSVTALPIASIEAIAVEHDLHSTHEAALIAEQCLYSDVISLVEASVADLRGKASTLVLSGKKNPRVEIQTMESHSIPVRVRVEREAFARVINSMLKRSLLSLNGENGLIRVSSRVGLHAITIVIEDNGWGFREKFLQLKSVEKAAAQAEEVGMSLDEAQKLLEFWGGRIEILSRLGVGSRVTLELERTDAYISTPPSPEGPIALELVEAATLTPNIGQ